MESLRRLTSSIFDGESRLSLGRRGSIGSVVLSPNSEAAALAAQRFAPSDLDITFITERLIVMGFPVQGPTNKKHNQNNIDDLAEYLETHHSNQYLIFNLNSLEDDASQLVQVHDMDAFISATPTMTATATPSGDRKLTNAIAEKVRQQMVEFAWERDGMKAHTPPFDHVFRICYSIFAWLSLDPSNVALINCQTGKTRSGIVVASYLMYARLADDPIDAFVEFYRKRWNMKSLTADALRQKTPPSIQRFLTSFHDLIENQRIPNDKPLLLKGIIIRAVPVEFQPCVQIWDDYRLAYCTSEMTQRGSDLSSTGPVIDWDCEDGCLAILWEDGLDLDGGFSILCSFGDDYDDEDSNIDAPSKVLFRYADSTWFLAPGLMSLTKSKLDMMKQYEKAFSEEHFSMDLVFVESKKSKRKYVPIDCTGNVAVKQGVIEITKQHVVLPDPGMHSNFMKMGFSDAATTFALQRSQNAPNIALDLLHSSVLATCFGQSKKAVQQERARPALQSYSSASLLNKNHQSADTGVQKPQPIVRRQSTAEIAALQSQRSRYPTPAVIDVVSQCSVCKDDDYMMRPQIVLCKGQCGGCYHTTCVGLKRIPFGLTTLSDRTNHGVYVKKYFSAWECDSCTSARSTQPLEQPTSLRATTVSSKVSQRVPSLQKLGGQVVSVGIENGVVVGAESGKGGETIDKLKEFLAMSGVSVDDLLRAATTANVAISPSPISAEVPQVVTKVDSTSNIEVSCEPEGSTKPASPSNGALGKLFAARSVDDNHGNPQDSAPKKDMAHVQTASAEAAMSASQHRAEERLSTTTARVESRLGVKSSPVLSSSSSNPTEKAAKPVISAQDPKTALLSQIAARRLSTSTGEPVEKAGASSASLIDEKVVEQSSDPQSDDTMKKYIVMLQRGVPYEAVKSCMQKDGVDSSALKPLSDPTNASDAAKRTKLKDMDEFGRYFNMVRIGCPAVAVKQKMIMDGADPIVLDLGPDAIFEEVKGRITLTAAGGASTLQDDIKSVKSHKAVATPEASTNADGGSSDATIHGELLLKDHDEYSKYFKMLKMGLPEDAVRQKMQKDGLDLMALELGGDALYSQLIKKPAGIRLGDDATYGKFFKMLKLGLPEDAVRHKMEMEGADLRALALGPDAFVSQVGAGNGGLHSNTLSPPTKVKARRKKLHWQPISDDRLSSINRQTIWEDKGDEALEFDMDMAEIESLFFASNDGAKKKTAGGAQAKTLKRKQSVTLIDGKRAMNAAISLARVKLSYAEIAQAISVFDANGLSVEQLRGICEFLPTAEEAELVTNYGGDVSVLGEAEKFIMEICKVKRYTARAECLLFKMSFAPRFSELSASLENLIGACQQVKESRLLKILLSMVLKLGNTLNGGGDDSEIRGFAVDSLLRLGHTKAVNQKTTVLHYLVRLVKKNHPAVLDFQGELKSVPLAARESFESVDEDYGKLQSGLTRLSEEFQELQKQDELDESLQKTVDSLQKAVEVIGGQMEALDRSIKQARDEVQSVLEYFGEDPAKNPSAFFTTLASFCSLFESARKEVDAADEAALRAERLKMRRNVSMRPTPVGSPSSALRAAVKGLRPARERAMSDRGFYGERSPPKL